ncbi:hypothetical protein RJ639_031018 [Escallonia herrerae]|uniref:Aconitate hydratase n=1 Tax=Escallonia herrerae TaxID=1293975 RepID=A0AA88WZI8_9ASTE|nr:hypothetical protein RJ639_031018 [Escallonia herrerae]
MPLPSQTVLTAHFYFIMPCVSLKSRKISFWVAQVPVDLVIDHSVQVDVSRSENALQANMELEFEINK